VECVSQMQKNFGSKTAFKRKPQVMRNALNLRTHDPSPAQVGALVSIMSERAARDHDCIRGSRCTAPSQIAAQHSKLHSWLHSWLPLHTWLLTSSVLLHGFCNFMRSPRLSGDLVKRRSSEFPEDTFPYIKIRWETKQKWKKCRSATTCRRERM